MLAAMKNSFTKFLSPEADDDIKVANDSIKNLIPSIWLLGKTGAGKSTLIHTLTGNEDVLIGNGYMPCTQNSSEFPFPKEKPIVKFLDTRGLSEANYEPDQDIAALSEQSNQIVLLMRMDEQCHTEVLSNLKKIQKCADGKALSSNLVVVYSHAESVTIEERENIAKLFDEQVKKHWKGEYSRVVVDFHAGIGVEDLKDLLSEKMPLVMEAMVGVDGDVDDFVYSKLKQDILWYAASAGAIDAIPVAGAVSVPVIQGKMLYDIASKIGIEWNNRELMEFSSALGSSIAAQFGFSFIARQAAKVIPVYGQTAGAAVSATIGFASTFALGKAACYYMQCKKKGEPIDKDSLRTMFRDALSQSKSNLDESNSVG